MIRPELIPAAVFASTLALLIAGCAATPGVPTPEQKSELAPTGTLRIAVFTGNPVLGARDKATGEVGGTTVTMGRALAQAAGVPARIVEYTAIGKLGEEGETAGGDIADDGFDTARRNVRGFRRPPPGGGRPDLGA